MATIEYITRGPDEEGLWSVYSVTTKETMVPHSLFIGKGITTESKTKQVKAFTNWVSDHDSFEDAYAHCCYMTENYS